MMGEQQIQICWEEPEVEGYLSMPGTLVTKNADACVALCIFEGRLEIHLVEPTADECEYKLLSVLDELFDVGHDVDAIIRDLHQLTVIEFVGKYKGISGHDEKSTD